MKPKILIIADEGYNLNHFHYMINLSYGDAISKAGGLPLVALSERLVDEYFNLCDGVIFTDGAFVHAKQYNEFYNMEEELPELSIMREMFEFSILELATKHKKPILAIGRGLNVVNAYFGGSLKTDNDKQVINHLSNALVKTGNVYKHKQLPIFALDTTPNTLDDYSQTFLDFINACKGETL